MSLSGLREWMMCPRWGQPYLRTAARRETHAGRVGLHRHRVKGSLRWFVRQCQKLGFGSRIFKTPERPPLEGTRPVHIGVAPRVGSKSGKISISGKVVREASAMLTIDSDRRLGIRAE
jgi:hypothetical protein